MCRRETKSSSATMMWSASCDAHGAQRVEDRQRRRVIRGGGERHAARVVVGEQHAARAALERVFHNFAHIELDAAPCRPRRPNGKRGGGPWRQGTPRRAFPPARRERGLQKYAPACSVSLRIVSCAPEDARMRRISGKMSRDAASRRSRRRPRPPQAPRGRRAKHRVERAEFLHQPVRDGVRILPRHGVVKEKLEHLVVGERIEPVGAELLFFARAMSFVYRHVCSPFRGVFAAKRGSLLLFLS